MQPSIRLALLSDIHANIRALHACLAHARGQGATHFALLGDLVGYGAEPGEVVDEAMALAAAGAAVIKGNHDTYAVAGQASRRTMADTGAAWTHAQLRPDQLNYLDQLPLTAVSAGALLVHASADEPAAWHYVDNVPRATLSLEAARWQWGVQHVFVGHVHRQRLFYEGRGGGLMPFDPVPGAPVPLAPHRHWIATVGSVGQPRDGDTRAMYALWEPAPQPRITFFRVPYEHQAAAQAVRRAGLPEFSAQRLMEGR